MPRNITAASLKRAARRKQPRVTVLIYRFAHKWCPNYAGDAKAFRRDLKQIVFGAIRLGMEGRTL